jgi:hypothetical protein
MTPNELLQLVEAAIVAKGLTPTQFGSQAIKDPNLVRDLRAGRELRHDTQQRVLEFIKTATVKVA